MPGNLRNACFSVDGSMGYQESTNERINLSEHLNEPVLLETVNQMANNRKGYEENCLDNQVHWNAGFKQPST